MADDKIARICWNTNGWRMPSGPKGKSKNKKTYEYKHRFGHEEWLLDTTKLIDGWHYAHLQPIGLHRDKYVEQTFNISLYSINAETKERWWVGCIRGVEVIPPKVSRKIYVRYKENGWLKEMETQLDAVGVSVKDFRSINPNDFVLVRFRPTSLELLDTPLMFSADDSVVGANWYTLLNQKKTPKLQKGPGEFTFTPGHRKKKTSAVNENYENQRTAIDLVHNEIQTNIYQQLAKHYGKENVGTEQETENGSQIDIVVKDKDNKFIFFEIKTSYSTQLSIREALGQLLEYAYFSKAANAKKLVIVSPNIITTETESYLKHLRERRNLPICYRQYNPEKKALEDTEY